MDRARINRVARVGRVAMGASVGELRTAAVAAGGGSLTLTFRRAVSATTPNTGWTLRATNGDLSGDGAELAPGDPVAGTTTIVFNGNTRLIDPGEVLSLEYSPATGETTVDATGQELTAITGFPVANNA
jgi:hypothetical protein